MGSREGCQDQGIPRGGSSGSMPLTGIYSQRLGWLCGSQNLMIECTGWFLPLMTTYSFGGFSLKEYTQARIMASPVGQMVKNLQCGRPRFDPWVGKIPWRREWQPTPVSLPGKSHGQRSLVGYSPWGCRESDRTERLSLHFMNE